MSLGLRAIVINYSRVSATYLCYYQYLIHEGNKKYLEEGSFLSFWKF